MSAMPPLRAASQAAAARMRVDGEAVEIDFSE